MINSGCLAMFTDVPLSQYVPLTYDLRQVKCAVGLIYGGRDELVEVDSLEKLLPNVVLVHKQADFEHLDTMWGDRAAEDIYPKVEALIWDNSRLKHDLGAGDQPS
ncbi:unnamed protein product [Choristocarpus tenellus]